MVRRCFSLIHHMELSGRKDARHCKSTNIQLPLKVLAYNSVPSASILTGTKTHWSFHLSQSQRALLVTHVSPNQPTINSWSVVLVNKAGSQDYL